jgi:hypothetical protein
LAETENRLDDAAKSNLDGIALGQGSSRGGTIIDALVGLAIESVHTAALEKLGPRLPAKSCHEITSALEAAEASRDTPQKVLQQELHWVRRAHGLRGLFARVVNFKSINRMEQSFVGKVQSQQMRTRRLILNLAQRTYELENAHSPTNIADLVPAYLKSVPQDPYTGTNMILGL